MVANPFLCQSRLDLPLQQDICQRILYAALRAAARGVCPESIPADVSLEQLRRGIRLGGASTCLWHPDEVARIFAGVTLRAYQVVEALYCSRLERSIRMVWRIVDAMAQQAGIPRIEYTAIWAICLYLEERRKENSRVAVECRETVWEVIQFHPNVIVRNGAAPTFRPAPVCVVDTQSSRVLAFRIAGQEDASASASLALYDAIVSQRRPAREAAGLVWQVPSRVATRINLAANCRAAFERLKVAVEPANGILPLVHSLDRDWGKELEGRTFSTEHFAVLFDTYLQRVHGYGPLRAREDQDREFSQQVGYNRDPAWQFPVLRLLLPEHSGRIMDNAVEYDGLHYADELLTYWPNHTVTLRRSEQSEARAWVYLDGEMLCQAMARELRRQDGSYRSRR